ncbi:Sulfotransferase family protein [Thalassovita gelatinovora]|uniref:Sulfotransferase family protein n=1 Tax=Thalassovita gelatinovora TaxID=53501 RepID=A0A0P1F6C9_THAGE|nr:sulfotransferase family 2 domain-containing protein [Thalassovita gelatinovora]QIZ80943.1 sulfotransferase family protein [Thalassovita gelatinovora]CUH63462.1 Sulfotransferase family protein [Thalassovita gelatinovora]SEQ67340.1 Sulfotransferase family protein [Thalassovita gelatinovora]
MISSKFRFIYIHIPKTGGNALQSSLIPFSDDEIQITEGHHDGINRFGLSGPITDKKHTNLQFYADALGGELTNYKVVVSRRHPFERAVSFYYSPHRWIRKSPKGDWSQIEPIWDESEFLNCLSALHSMVSYITVNEQLRKPDVEIRTEYMQEDCKQAFDDLKIPVGAKFQIPNSNMSAGTKEQVLACLSNYELRDAVEQRYADDMKYFDYPTYLAKGA